MYDNKTQKQFLKPDYTIDLIHAAYRGVFDHTQLSHNLSSDRKPLANRQEKSANDSTSLSSDSIFLPTSSYYYNYCNISHRHGHFSALSTRKKVINITNLKFFSSSPPGSCKHSSTL